MLALKRRNEACTSIHTSYIKETLRKLISNRFLLYRQLLRRANSRFSENNVLYSIHKHKLARSARKTIFPPAAKTAAAARVHQTLFRNLLSLENKKVKYKQTGLHTDAILRILKRKNRLHPTQYDHSEPGKLTKHFFLGQKKKSNQVKFVHIYNKKLH